MTNKTNKPFPICIATWNFPNASQKAGEMLEKGATALDAVERDGGVHRGGPSIARLVFRNPVKLLNPL